MYLNGDIYSKLIVVFELVNVLDKYFLKMQITQFFFFLLFLF